MHIKLKLINITNCIQNCKFSLSDANTISCNASFHSSTSVHFRVLYTLSQSLLHRRLSHFIRHHFRAFARSRFIRGQVSPWSFIGFTWKSLDASWLYERTTTIKIFCLYAYWTIRRQTNSRSVKSRTGQLAEVNSPTSIFIKSRKDYTIFVH